MGKRGLGILVAGVLIFGFLIGYSLPLYQAAKQQEAELQQRFDSEAWQSYNQGNIDRAIELFSEYAANDESNLAAALGLGWSHYSKGNYQEAQRWFERSTVINPAFYDAHNGLAWSHYAQGQYQEASDSFRRALALTPTLTVYSGLGRSYYHLGDHDSAVETLEEVHKKNPSLIFPQAVFFLIAHEQGDEEKTQELLENIIPFKYDLGADPDHDYVRFADCMFKLREEQENLREAAYGCGELI